MTKMKRMGGEPRHVDPVDATFAAMFLAELVECLEHFRAVFPDSRLCCRFVQAVKGGIAAARLPPAVYTS
jgi:hypothetical protein